MTLKESLEEAIKRIEKKTVRENGCWLFQGAKNNGRGVIRFYNSVKQVYTMERVHRISAALYLNYDLSDKEHQINHNDTFCSNINCWNPVHLYIGTKSDNAIDSVMKGNHFSLNRGKTHCKRGHELTEDNIYVSKIGSRQCKQCTKDRALARHK